MHPSKFPAVDRGLVDVKGCRQASHRCFSLSISIYISLSPPISTLRNVDTQQQLAALLRERFLVNQSDEVAFKVRLSTVAGCGVLWAP